MSKLSEQVAEKLGLPPDADEQTILDEVNRLQEAGAARQVDKAIACGAISAGHRQVWLNSFKADADGTKAALASIEAQAAAVRATYLAPVASVPAPGAGASPADDGLTDEEANDCMWRLGLRAGLQQPKAKYTYLANADGTMYRTERYTGL